MSESLQIPNNADQFSDKEQLWLMTQYYRAKKQSPDARQQCALLYQMNATKNGFTYREMGIIKTFLHECSYEYYEHMKSSTK